MSTIEKIAEAFVNELSARYDLPELKGIVLVQNPKNTEPDLKGEISATPRGQLAAIVRELKVRIWVYGSEGRYEGEIAYSYEHQDGGSNGSKQRFIILCQQRYGEDRYAGMINDRLAYNLERQLAADARKATTVK